MKITIRAFPYHFKYSTVRGRIIPSRGLLHNIRLESNQYEPTYPALAWTHDLPDAGQTDESRIVRVWRDGDLTHTVRGYDRQVVSALRGTGTHSGINGGYVRYELEAVSPYEDVAVDSANAFAVFPIGDRAHLTWTECTANDFTAYKLYWNAGSGATADTLVDTIYGAAQTEYISSRLTQGLTYYFALAFLDAYGNESAIGTASTITAEIPPLALTGPTISYNATTRVATLSGVHPAGQHADIAGVALHDNYLAGVGLSEYPNINYGFKRKFFL